MVIVGGGFGGLYAARALSGKAVNVTLIDRRNHHLFQPLLYQVATAALNPSEIAMPLRRIFRRHRNIEVLLGEAVEIDRSRRVVVLTDGEIAYDRLIVATGATHSYFGRPEWEPIAPGLKTLEDAIDIRRRLLLAFEAAERETDPDRRRAWLTFVIVGGGPTGVEMAGAFAEIARHALSKDFRHIDPSTARVILVEALDRVLTSFPQDLSDKARLTLERTGVEVMTSSSVTEVTSHSVRLGETEIPTRTVVWAAGVRASELGSRMGAELDRSGRVMVEKDLTLQGDASVYVIGDLAHFEQEGRMLPGVAQVAIQQGKHAAANIVLDLGGRPRRAFAYKDRGSLATIGRAAAVASFPSGLKLWGFAAWVVWLFVHILYLIGFRNRLLVMGQWAWAYLRWERGARLITGEPGPLRRD